MGDDLSLLLKIRGDAAGAKQATAETRAAITALRSQMGGEFGQIQNAANSVFSTIGNNLNVFIGERLPLVGGAFVRVTENLRGLGEEAQKGQAGLSGLEKTVAGLANTTGKSSTEIRAFLSSFVNLKSDAARAEASIKMFGGTMDTLTGQVSARFIPELEKAGTQMGQVAGEAEGMGSGLAAAAGPIGIAVLALAALTTGAVLLSKEFIDLTISTADWQGKMQDLSQQLGVSTELLSGLEILSKTTGGSIEQLAASLGIFQKNLEESQDPASKQAALIKELGIDTTNTETAFRSAIKSLADMDEGYHQTATALELFGRGGKSVLAIIKETNGDLDAAIEKFREMGLVVSGESAKAADEFNDQLAILGFQARATTGIIAQESIPQILTALRETSKILAENREAISVLGSAIALFAEGNVKGILVPALNLLKDVLASTQYAFAGVEYAALRAAGASHEAALEIANARREARSEGEALPGASAGISGQSMIQGLTGGIEAVTTPKGLGGAAKISEGQRLLNQLTEEYNRLQEKADKLTKAQIVDEELKQKKYDKTSDSLKEQIRSVATWITIDEQAAEQKKKDAEAQKIYDHWLEEQFKIINSLNPPTQSYLDKLRELEVALEKTGGQAKDSIAHNETEIKQRLALIAFLSTEAEALKNLDKWVDQVTESFTANEDVNKRVVAGYEAQALAIQKLADEYKPFLKVLDEQIKQGRELAAQTDATIGKPPPVPILNTRKKQHDEMVKQLREELSTVHLLGGAYSDLFQSIGQGVGSMIENFVLMGNAGEASFKKILASALASLAGRAAADAIYELAIGFAALTPWGAAIYGPAALHFQAAALLGSIAGVAAVAGRAVAGNSFAQPSTAGSSGAGGSLGGSGSSNQSPATIKEEWVQRRPIIIQIHGEAGAAFNYKVLDVIDHDFDINGRTARRIKVQTNK